MESLLPAGLPPLVPICSLAGDDLPQIYKAYDKFLSRYPGGEITLGDWKTEQKVIDNFVVPINFMIIIIITFTIIIKTIIIVINQYLRS